MSQVMAREQGDIHPSDVDLLSPGFLDPPCPTAQAPSPHSVVSNWSQLSQGSRLSADSSYRDDLLLPSQLSQGSMLSADSRYQDDLLLPPQLSQGSRRSADLSYQDELLLPCSRDPSSEEGSDAKDLSEEEELEPVDECKELSQDDLGQDNDFGEKEIEDEELHRNREGSKEDKEEAVPDVKVEGHTLLANVAEEVKIGQKENPCDNDEQSNGVAIKCVTANEEKKVEIETPVKTTELTQTPLEIKDLDTVIEDLIPKKKNKKRRKHAKKKKPGAIGQEEEHDEEEDVPVEA